jgi:hypothetical protein
VHIRQARALPRPDSGPLQVDGGYLQDEGRVARYQRLSIPVRRALNPTDRASVVATLAALDTSGGVDPQALATVHATWQRLQAELDSGVNLGGRSVRRREILSMWMDAAAFYDKLDRDRAYDQLIDRVGKAAEAMGAQLLEDAAEAILAIDTVCAAALHEPIVLPPPLKTPPPPRDPADRWWKKIFS